MPDNADTDSLKVPPFRCCWPGTALSHTFGKCPIKHETPFCKMDKARGSAAILTMALTMEKEKSTGSFASFASTGGIKPILAALLHSRLVALVLAKAKQILKASAGNRLSTILKESKADSMRLSLSRTLTAAVELHARHLELKLGSRFRQVGGDHYSLR
jgi:hypothetical protein